MAAKLEGGCSCGALRYELNRKPMLVHCCHCTQCQKLTGSAFVLNAIIENDAIDVVQGEVILTPGPSDTGRPHDVYRCAACHTAVWTNYAARANYRFVRVGTLDDPSLCPPDVHIFTRAKLDWVAIPAGVPAFETMYEVDEFWPAEALARRRAALAA